MRLLRGLIVVVLISIGFTLSAQAIVIRHDVPEAKYLEFGRQFSFIAHLNIPRGEGTLIAPQWVLTAAHAARGLKSGYGVTIAGKLYPVETVILHPQWH